MRIFCRNVRIPQNFRNFHSLSYKIGTNRCDEDLYDYRLKVECSRIRRVLANCVRVRCKYMISVNNIDT